MNRVMEALKEISIQEGIKLYIVGGYVRDLILGRKNQDIDCVVKGSGENAARLLARNVGGKVIELGEKHKLYRVVSQKEGFVVDFTSMKGDSIEADLSKRDFTMNSLAIDSMDIDSFNQEVIIDPLKGIRDIEKQVIRYGYENVFKDDPIRMLRAVRFMSELGFSLSPETEERIKVESAYIQSVPGERITQELFKILENKQTFKYFDYMNEKLKLLQTIFPEIIEMKEVGECKYHVVDCLTHSLHTLRVIEEIIYAEDYFEDHIRKAYEEHSQKIIASNHSRLSIIKLGAFFHDVGKPSAKKVDEKGRTRFKGHEITGAEMIRGIAERLKMSIKERDTLYKMTAKHMLPLVLYKSNDVSGKSLFGMFSELGEETLDVLLISLGDIIATRELLNPQEEMGKYKVHIEYLVNNYLTRYKEIEDISDIITGREIIEGYHLGKGVIIGDLIEEVRKAIYNGKIPYRKKAVLDYLKKLLV